MASTILAVPGLAATSPEFRAELSALAERHSWDVDAIAAIMSRESGFKASAKNPTPGQTATGLIQFTAATLRGLGFTGTRDDFASLTDIEQLPFVERYYARAFPTHAPSRPVDYHRATFGASSGLPLDFVLAHAGDHLYEVNAGLDTNSDGQITVSDLASALAVTMQ